MRTLIVTASALIALGTTAIAGSRTTVVFNQSTSKCDQPRTEPADGDQSYVEVSIVENDAKAGIKAAPAKKNLAVRVLDGETEIAGGTVKAKNAKLAAPVTFAATVTATVLVDHEDRDKAKPWACQLIVKASAAPPPSKQEQEQEEERRKAAGDAAVLEQARQYLIEERIFDHARTGYPTGRTYKLYHLPDGSPAFPLPNKVAEEDHVELWVVEVAGERVDAEITTCKDVPPVRIIGSRSGKAAEPVKSGEPDRAVAPAPPPTFELRRVAAPAKCAEQLSYKLRTGYGEREISIKIAPVHLFSWGLAYGFDFGRPTRLRLVERPASGGAGETERVIVRENDRSGFQPMITLTLNACRANIDDWDVCDAVGLTAMADPGRLKEGGGLGLKLQPYPGLGVLIGLTFFQVDTLEKGRGLNVDDVFVGSGDLPIDKEFRWGKSFGLFLGVGGDTDTVKKLF